MLQVTVSVQTNDGPSVLESLADHVLDAVERLHACRHKNGGSIPTPTEIAEVERSNGRVVKTKLVIESLPES